VTAKNSPNLGKDAADVAGLKSCGVSLTSDIHTVLDTCDVLIDFSHPGATIDAALAMHREGRGDARTEGQIGFAALRGGGVIGTHEVRIASELEMITLSHDAFDRSVFASGAVTAALWAAKKPAGIYNMKDVLGL